MADVATLVHGLTPAARRRLRQELDRIDPPCAETEAVAVIGLGLRLPGGVTTPADFWDFLAGGGDGVVETPTDRWEPADGQTDDRAGDPSGDGHRGWGGYLDGVDLFDAAHFGISPTEAQAMDPQQRLLLETTTEALVHAGLASRSLRGSATGVFLGIASSDYLTLGAASDQRVDAYAATGNPHSIAAGRLSYIFDWHGPCLAIDTACSSSLAAVDAACQNLRQRRCDLAVSGGVHLILDPRSTDALGAWSMLSPDGKCKSFDALANGFVRGEGCVVLVLKRLADALADGDRVWAVVAGGAVNQDGRSNGLTAPNIEAQAAVMRSALDLAGARAADVALVETHGTGTPLGDPVEFSGLARVYGEGTRPLYLGAVKTNLGHLEAAAGAAGLAKTVLCLDRGHVPPNLHFRSWHPALEADRQRFRAPVATEPLWAHDGRITAGVSSFGFGGTNVHLIVTSPPAAPWPSTWVFPGQGGQFPAMGRRFLHEEPVFAAAAEVLEPMFLDQAGFSLLAVLEGSAEARGLSQVQPSLFGFQVAAAAMVEARQGPPEAVIGHSMGEVAAAVAAGVLDAAQGLRVIAVRSALMQRLAAGGAMAVMACPADQAAEWLQAAPTLEVAALNEPCETVISGPGPDIDELIARCAREHGPTVTAINVDVASHSRCIDAVLAPLRESLADLGPAGAARCPVYSTTAGPTTWDADYWARNLRGTVRFKEAVERALAAGAARFTELSPHPVLSKAVRACAGPDAAVSVRAVQLRPPQWRRSRFWMDGASGGRARRQGVLDAHVVTPAGDHLFQGDWGLKATPWLGDHRLFGAPLVPGAALVELCAGAAEAAGRTDGDGLRLEAIELRRLLPLEETTVVTAEARPTGHIVEVTSSGPDGPISHAAARWDEGGTDWPEPLAPPATTGAETISGAQFYAQLRRRGQDYGPAFQVVEAVEDLGSGWVQARLAPGDASPKGTVFDPTVLDGAWQMMAVGLPAEWADATLVPVAADLVAWRRVRPVISRAVGYRRQSGADWAVDVDLWEETGTRPALSLRGLRVQRLGRSSVPWAWSRSLFEVAWHEVAGPGGPLDRDWAWTDLSGSPLTRSLEETWRSRAGREADTAPAIDRAAQHGVLVIDDPPTAPLTTATTGARRLLDAVVGLAAGGNPPALVTLVVLGDREGPASQAARALVRTVALEDPGFALRAISHTGDDLDRLAQWIGADWAGDTVALTEAGALAARVRGLAGLPAPTVGRIRPDGAYIVTGGAGGLGAHVVASLLERGAGRVVVNGRTAPAPGRDAPVDGLWERDDVVFVAGDIGRPETARRCVEAATDSGLRLSGVIHAAGQLADRSLATTTAGLIDRVWEPKVAGVVHLDEATRSDDLDFFTVFSSAAAALGSPGQAAYGAANAVMEAVVGRRRARGQRGNAVQWGRWGEVGLAAGAANRLMEPLAPADGLTALRHLLGAGSTTLVARLNAKALAANFPAAGSLDFYAPITAGLETAEAVDVDRLRALRPDEARAEIRRHVIDLVAALMGYDRSEVPVGSTLTGLGVDSLMVVRLTRAINRAFGLDLGVTTLLQGPSVAAVADEVARRLRPAEPAPTAADDPGKPDPGDAPDTPDGSHAPDDPDVPDNPDDPDTPDDADDPGSPSARHNPHAPRARHDPTEPGAPRADAAHQRAALRNAHLAARRQAVRS